MEQVMGGQLGEKDVHGASHKRVVRFIRPGWDVMMERKGADPETALRSKKGFGRVSYFLASRVARESVTGTNNPVNNSNFFKHIDCFTSSGVEKGEGYHGGGTTACFMKIGFNPGAGGKSYRELECRGKRQRRPKQTTQDTKKTYTKPPPLDAKTSVTKQRERERVI